MGKGTDFVGDRPFLRRAISASMSGWERRSVVGTDHFAPTILRRFSFPNWARGFRPLLHPLSPRLTGPSQMDGRLSDRVGVEVLELSRLSAKCVLKYLLKTI